MNMQLVHMYLPLLMYLVFFVTTLLLMGYNKLYQHEIQKSKAQIGVTAPERVISGLKVGYYMGCAILILLSIFTIQSLLSIFLH